MSNAIELKQNKVLFSAEEIDVDALRRLLDAAEAYSKTAAARRPNPPADAPVPDDPFGDEGTPVPPTTGTVSRTPEEEERENNLDATALFLLGAVKFRKDSVEIAFGSGECKHTWRDFKWVLNHVIHPLMKQSKKHDFLVADIDFYPPDEPAHWGLLEVDFLKGIEE